MKVEVKRTNDPSIFRADATELPGSPPLGMGFSPNEAIINLFQKLLVHATSKCSTYDLTGFDFNRELEITLKYD